MSNAAPRFGRLIRHTWIGLARNLTHWAIVGTVIAMTGFGPEHWFAAVFHYVQLPEPVGHLWSWLDVRAAIVCVGVAIVVADVLFRRRAQRQENKISTVSGAGAPAADPAPAIQIKQSVLAGEGFAHSPQTGPNEESAHPPAVSLPDNPSIVVFSMIAPVWPYAVTNVVGLFPPRAHDGNKPTDSR